MFRLLHQNKVIGTCKFESGDPSIGSVSGELMEAGTCEEVSAYILAERGVEDDGVFLLEIDDSFLVVLDEHTPVPFAEGSLICVPAENEVYLEIVGIPKPEYAHFFYNHIKEFMKDDKQAE